MQERRQQRVAALFRFATVDKNYFAATRFEELRVLVELFEEKYGGGGSGGGGGGGGVAAAAAAAAGVAEVPCARHLSPETHRTLLLEGALASEEMGRFIAARSLNLVNVNMRLASADSLEELTARVRELHEADPSVVGDLVAEGRTFSLVVEGLQKRFTAQEKTQVREAIFGVVPPKGKVKLDGPDTTLAVIREPAAGVDRERWYFVKRIADGARSTLITKYTLKKRTYLGPTSTDAELSMIMANLAKVTKGSLVFDPFVGTGSILVACTHYGACCVGQDFDYRVLHGMKKGKFTGKTIEDNFNQYGFVRPEVVCADNSIPPWRSTARWDAIVCDPPYGVRAGARKSGAASGHKEVLTGPGIDRHFPMSQPYGVNDVMVDLIKLAAHHLRIGGRLVYLLPTEANFDQAMLVTHPAFAVLSCSEQRLRMYARQVVVMEKQREPLPTDDVSVPEDVDYAAAGASAWEPKSEEARRRREEAQRRGVSKPQRKGKRKRAAGDDE